MNTPLIEIPASQFTTELPVLVWGRPPSGGDWQALEGGPGVVNLPPNMHILVRLRTIHDAQLREWAAAARDCKAIIALSLSENRRVSDAGLEILAHFPQLVELNLSSCDLTNEGLKHLQRLGQLEKLDLSYCNRINDQGLKSLRNLTRLRELNLKGCARITHSGVARLGKPGVKISR